MPKIDRDLSNVDFTSKANAIDTLDIWTLASDFMEDSSVIDGYGISHVQFMELVKIAAQVDPKPHKGVLLIRYSYFLDYTKQVAEEETGVDRQDWPLCRVNWGIAATDLLEFYKVYIYDGINYHVKRR